MQKLIWVDSKGNSIDLTSGNFGITNWEGFSNTSLNIQSQQVPFHDGSVFLDALLEPRELNVTLAIQDKGNLETRYGLRRELIHILNPKSGEGYLIYKNDFTQKRIKCISQIPLFENHNSNDSGTPKATLSWTACEPYWEDLEETTISMNCGELTKIINNGDFETPVKISFFGSSDKTEIINETTQKKICVNNNNYDEVFVNTEFGKKEVLAKELNFDLLLTRGKYDDITYSKKLNLIVAVGDKIIISNDGYNWTPEKHEGTFSIGNTRHIAYSEVAERFIILGVTGVDLTPRVLVSTDGINWNLQVTNMLVDKITYSDELGLFVGCISDALSNISYYTSYDGVTWELQEGTNYEKYFGAYSEDLSIYVKVKEGDIYSSTDGENWTLRHEHDSNSFEGVVYSKDTKQFIAYTREQNYYVLSTDGITWSDEYLIHTNGRLSKLIYVESYGFVIGCTKGGSIVISSNLENWNSYLIGEDIDIDKLVYSEELGIFVSAGSGSYISEDGVNWIKTINNPVYDIFYWKEKQLFVSLQYLNGNENVISLSTDGINWTNTNFTIDTRDITFCANDDKIVMVYYAYVSSQQYENHIYVSTDGINWTNTYNETSEFTIMSVTYSKDLNKFIGVWRESYSSKTYESIDCITWNTTTQYPFHMRKVIYNDELKIFIGIGDGEIHSSNDGLNWIKRKSARGIQDIAYFEGVHIFFVCGEKNYISYDGINWEEKNFQVVANFLCVSEKLFTVMNGLAKLDTNESQNIINNLSTDSDMTFSLVPNTNECILRKNSGSLYAKMSYRQRYIGV